MDKSIEQIAEEMADERYVLHVFKDRHVINRERAAFIEGYKACQQNLEVSERFELTEPQITRLANIGNKYLYLDSMDEGAISYGGILEIIKNYEMMRKEFIDSLPKANS